GDGPTEQGKGLPRARRRLDDAERFAPPDVLLQAPDDPIGLFLQGLAIVHGIPLHASSAGITVGVSSMSSSRIGLPSAPATLCVSQPPGPSACQIFRPFAFEIPSTGAPTKATSCPSRSGSFGARPWIP